MEAWVSDCFGDRDFQEIWDRLTNVAIPSTYDLSAFTDPNIFSKEPLPDLSDFTIPVPSLMKPEDSIDGHGFRGSSILDVDQLFSGYSNATKLPICGSASPSLDQVNNIDGLGDSAIWDIILPETETNCPVNRDVLPLSEWPEEWLPYTDAAIAFLKELELKEVIDCPGFRDNDTGEVIKPFTALQPSKETQTNETNEKKGKQQRRTNICQNYLSSPYSISSRRRWRSNPKATFLKTSNIKIYLRNRSASVKISSAKGRRGKTKKNTGKNMLVARLTVSLV